MFEKFSQFEIMNDEKELIADEFEKTLKREANISVNDLQKIVIEKNFNLITKENFEGIISFLHFYGYHDFNNYIDEFIRYTDKHNLAFDISFTKNIFKLDKIFSISCVGCEEKCNTVKKTLDRNHVYCLERFGKNEFKKFWPKYNQKNISPSMCNFLITQSYLSSNDMFNSISILGGDDDALEYFVENYFSERIFKLLMRNDRIEMAKYFVDCHFKMNYWQMLRPITDCNSLDLFKYFHEKTTQNLTGLEKLKVSSSFLNSIDMTEMNAHILKFLLFDCGVSNCRESIEHQLQKMFLEAIELNWSDENLEIFIDAHLSMDSFRWLHLKRYPTFSAIHNPRIMQFLIDNGADLRSTIEKYGRTIMDVMENEMRIANLYKREFRYEKTYELLKEHLK